MKKLCLILILVTSAGASAAKAASKIDQIVFENAASAGHLVQVPSPTEARADEFAKRLPIGILIAADDLFRFTFVKPAERVKEETLNRLRFEIAGAESDRQHALNRAEYAKEDHVTERHRGYRELHNGSRIGGYMQTVMVSRANPFTVGKEQARAEALEKKADELRVAFEEAVMADYAPTTEVQVKSGAELLEEVRKSRAKLRESVIRRTGDQAFELMPYNRPYDFNDWVRSTTENKPLGTQLVAIEKLPAGKIPAWRYPVRTAMKVLGRATQKVCSLAYRN